jgi:hypothetical protein
MELNPVKKFYDELAADYHLNFGNWDEAIANQAKILDKNQHVEMIPRKLSIN